MQELIDFLVQSFIPRESYDLVTIEENDELEIKVKVDKEHIARLIGRNGRIAKAIRTLVKAKAIDGDIKCTVSIEDR